MKIGIVAPYDVLSLVSGASVRVYELARGLSSFGASVYVLHHGPTKSIRSNLKFLKFRAFNVVQGGSNYLHPLNVAYPTALFYFLREFKPDIIQCEQPWSTIPTFLLTRNRGIPCVLDEHNVEFAWSLSASRLPFLAPVNFVLEKIAISHSSCVLTPSALDKQLLSRMYGIDQGRIHVIPNGVNLKKFSAITHKRNDLKRKLGLSLKNKIVLFHGMLSVRQNYEAARQIVDSIAPRLSNVFFLIIGKDPPNWLIIKANKQKNVMIMDFVPNIEEYIVASDACVAPIKTGSGTRLKILEYMAAGKPIVSTNKAVEGLGIVDGVHALLHEDIEENFLNSVNKILEDEELSKRLHHNVFELVQTYDWSLICSNLYRLYSDILRGS